MRYIEIESLYKRICKSLFSRNLKVAFDQLTLFIEKSQNGEWMDKKRELETTYQYMLQYAVDGINDPEQASIYNQLRISTLELADQVKGQLLLRDSTDFVSSQQRIHQNNTFPSNRKIVAELSSYNINASLAGLLEESLNASGKTVEFSKKHEKMLSSVFNHFWLTEKYKEREIELQQLIFKTNEIQFTDKCIIISAITLSLMRTFDVVKFEILLNIYNDSDEQIKQRAFIGFILGAYLFNERIRLYEKLTTRIEILMQEKSVVKNFQTVILQFIRSKETEKISKKMTEDFIPEMAKISPFIQEKMNLKDLLKEDNSLLDKNPEWQEILDKAGITDKIQQFAELQMEGADVFMSTFSSMKNFPFFREINNWFMPFSNHSSVSEFFQRDNQSGILDTIVKSPFLCNSDKYSLVFSMLQMPKSYRDTMIQSLKMEAEQMEEIKKDEEILAQSSKGEAISNQYIQDIYRFFKLYSRRKDFLDPFNTKLDLYNLFFIKDIENSDQLLRTIGEAYFNKDFYDEAIEIFEKLLIKDNMNIELYQKTGYSYQRKSNYNKALSLYKKADMIQPNNLWNIRKIAFCYRSLKDSEQALNYYLLAEKKAPDDLNIQLSIGHCYFEQKMYNEALQVFFKIEYLAPDNQKVWRPIAWCSFITGKLEQAEKYYSKIKPESRNHHDWINMGHINLCINDRKKALSLYKKGLELMDFDVNSFLQIIAEDIPFLVNNGVNKNEIPILMDKIRYDIKK
jgi:tetratricopeptide (TPR) repeat protein